MTVLILLSTSCVTSKVVDELPDIYFPPFPISVNDTNIKFSARENNIVITWVAENEEAVIPIWVWENFVRYEVDVRKAEKDYKKLQKAYEVQN